MTKICPFIIFALILVYTSAILAGESMKINENDAGKTIEMVIGDELEIMLPGNPTTGYVWESDSKDATELLLKQTSFMPANHAIGSGGVVTLLFRALATGKASLNLIYHRPFERNIPPIKTFEVTVNIAR